MKNKTYTFYEIQSYLTGKMSAEDMYEMEKNALSDPFLNAAIEGYRTFSAAKFEDIEQINTNILGQSTNLKLNYTPKPGIKPLKFAAIAASFIIGMGVMGYYFNQKIKENSHTIAKTPIENIQNNEQAEIKTIDNQFNTELKVEKPFNTDATNATKKKFTNKAIVQNFAEKVPKKFENTDSQYVLTDKTKSFPINLNSRKPPIEKEIIAQNQTQAPKRLLALNKTNSNLEITDIAKNENIPSQNLIFQNSIVQNNHVQPIGGWDVFVQNIQFRLGNISSSDNSYVKLKFTIQNGEPDNFQVLHSPNDQIAQQTIDIIRTGPKWKSIGKRTAAEVSIQLN